MKSERLPKRRFLEHWRPSAAVFVESELWPHAVSATADSGIPLALINASAHRPRLCRFHSLSLCMCPRRCVMKNDRRERR